MSSQNQSESHLFMMAQLPFNTQDAVTLNKPMIPIMNDVQNLQVVLQNLKNLGMSKEILTQDCHFLEIGAGNGYLIEYLLKHGKGKYTGIEPIETEIKKTKKRLDPYLKVPKSQARTWLHHGLLEDKTLDRKIKPESLDIIYSYHVFEHLENPLKMLELGKKWLKKNGKMIITCPNVEGYFPRKNLDAWRCNLSSHRWLPGESTLIRTMQHQRYDVVRFFTYGGYATPRTLWKNLLNQLFKQFHLGDVICLLAQKI